MSGLLDQAGLTAGSGLSNGAGLYRWGNFNPFDPTDLDPYLLFDTGAGSMIGTLENPTLDLDPSNQETLDVITATRAGVATYTDSANLIQVASADTVRVDYVDGVPMILVEPSSVNLVTYSEDFSDSGWLKNAVGTGVAPVVTLNAAESPDGTQNAAKIVFDTGSGTSTGDISSLEDLITVTNGASYTQSIYLKGETGGEKIQLRHVGGNTYTTVTLTNDWVRYKVTETAAATGIYFSIGLRQGVGGVVINSEITVYAYGAQLEAGSVATSYIPTSGSTVTRAADDLVISGSAFSSFFNAVEGTTYVETIPKSKANTPHLFEYYDASNANSNRMGSYIPALGVNYYVVPGSCNESMGTINVNQLNRFAVSYKTNDMLGSVNGVSEQADTSATLPSGVDTLSIGNMNTGASPMTGHIKRLLFWPTHSSRL